MSGGAGLRVLFLGTAAFARPCLRALVEAGHDVRAVVTQPDRPKGRSKTPTPPPLKEEVGALALACPVLQPERVRDAAALGAIADHGPFDVGVVVAYGQILPQELLDLPRLGCVNVHGSLLPRWRGASPVQRAVAAGDPETGVTIQQMVMRLDAGPVLSTAATPIGRDETSGALLERLATIGAELLTATLPRLAAGALEAAPQDESLATYAPTLHKREGGIAWTRQAVELAHHVRGMHPWPGAFTFVHRQGAEGTKPPQRLVVLAASEYAASAGDGDGPPAGTVRLREGWPEVRCGDGAFLRLERVQPAGKRPMTGEAWARGRAVAPGDRLGPREPLPADGAAAAPRP
jgi:methionyl-tRNA formyltransferase